MVGGSRDFLSYDGLTLPRRICYVETQDYAFLTHRKHLGRAALDLGMEVHVIAPAGDHVERLRSAGFVFHPLRMKRSGMNPVSESRAIQDLVRIYREVRPHLAHHVALKAVIYGSAAARIAHVAAVGSITGLGYAFIPGGKRRAVLREAVSLMLFTALRGRHKHTIFQNPDDQRAFVQKRLVRGNDTSVIYGSGVDTARFAPTPEPDSVPRVLIATRMLRDKGVVELVDAARMLRARSVPFELWLAGDTDAENPAAIPATQLKAWHDEGIVRWLGHAPDIAQLLRDAHIACLPSYREGLPLFLAEAAAAGRPAISTDVPGCRAVVQHERTGLLVPARESASLAAALERLLTNTPLRKRMGEQARSLALELFSKEQVTGAILRIYSSLLSS